MRRYIWAIALLLFCLTAQAADYYHLTDYVTTKNGSAISGASVNVYAANTTTTATAYTDFGGTIPVSWPLATDPNGMFECYLAQGNYDISITHTGRNIDTTWDNYMVGSGSDTLSYSSLNITGTIAAEAFDANDWIDAGGTITGETIETTGLSVIGGTFTTGGTVTVGGDLYVSDQAQFAWDAVDEVYNFRVGPNSVVVEPYLVVDNDAIMYGNMYLYGKDHASGKLHAQIVESDTLKPRTGSDLYVRSADGNDDAILHTQFLELDPVDVTVSLPDAGLYTKGTFFLGTDDTLRFKNDAGNWATFGTSYVIPDPDVPVLYLPTTTLNYAYADSHVQKFGVGNSGDGILSWESSFLSDWIADAANDTGTVGVGFDSVTVQLMWVQVDSGVSWYDTVAVTTDYGNGEVVIHVDGKPLVGGGDYVVEPNHPRVLVNENEVAGLRTKCAGAEASMYNDFINWVDGNTVLASYPLGTAEEHGINLQRLSFAHLVEQDTTGTYDYFELARECADSMFTNWSGTWHGGENAQRGLSLFYDWCYDDMTAWGRGYYGGLLAEACTLDLTGDNFMADAPHSQMDLLPEQMYMCLAIAGDGIIDVRAADALDTVFAHTFGDYHVMACFDSIARDGGGYEGDVYTAVQMQDQTEVFWLWDHGTDYDSWAASSNMTGNGNWMLYDTQAKSEVVITPTLPSQPYTHDGFTASKQGDDYAHTSAKQRQMLLTYRLSSAYEDSTLIWLSDQYDTHTNHYINNKDKWKWLIPKNTTLGAAAPTALRGYPTAEQFDVGTVFMREGWDLSPESGDVWAVYRHNQFPYGHAHADAGSFVLGRGHDLLFIKSGGYNSANTAHNLDYFRQTVASNGITVKHFSESFGGRANSGGQQRYQWSGAGGLPTTLGAYTDSLAGQFGDCGNITDYGHRPDTLTYIRSDLTNAYWSTKVDTVRREFVWMEPDGVFLIYDYVYATADTFLQKSLFHTINNPTLNGDDTWTTVHGTSEATLTFYGNASAQEIGGAGSEFWADGSNRPYVSATSYSDLGAYRIEALPTRSSQTRALVTIIETSVVGGADYGTVSTVAVGDYLGAVVNGDTLLFHKFGGTYQYRAQ